MPKIGMPLNGSNLPEVNPAIAEIQQCVHDIESLLAGRVDNDNMWADGDKYIQLSGKSVIDMADDTRPIAGMKFFGYTPGQANTVSRIYDPLITMMEDSKRFEIISGKTMILLNSDNTFANEAKHTYDFQYNETTKEWIENGIVSKRERIIDTLEYDPARFDAQRIIIPKPPNYRLVKRKDLTRYFRDAITKLGLPEESLWYNVLGDGDKSESYVISTNKFTNFSIGAGRDQIVNVESEIKSVTADEIIVDVYLASKIEVKKDEFLTASMEYSFLCEVMP